jgi:hypothetical protein
MGRLLIAVGLMAAAGCGNLPVQSWRENMVTYGQQYCQSGDNYYDAIRVYYQIQDATGDGKFAACAERAATEYVDNYLRPNQFKAAGWMIFPHGLLMQYQRTHDEKFKDALIRLSQNASFSTAPLEWTASTELSREVAYNLEAKLLAESVGVADRARATQLAEQALGHYDQWFVKRTTTYTRPFMAALTAEALILWYEKTQDPRVLPALKQGADWMWANMWLSSEKSFKYTDRKMEHGGEDAAPDLNLLIAPLYGWLYKMTGDKTYCERGDAIFYGGVWSSGLNNPKHFNQNYRWSFDYLKWRGDCGGTGTAPPKKTS